MKNFSNQNEVDALEKAVQELDPTLTLRRFGIAGDRAISAGFTLKEKGNKKLIDALISMGFRKTLRRKAMSSKDYYITLERSLPYEK